MNAVTLLLICLTILGVAYLLTRPRRLMYDGASDWWWPPTWTFDWGGGPYYDRHVILEREHRKDYGPPRATFSHR
jgi:hypothetical protein